jgi:hypothetical protein
MEYAIMSSKGNRVAPLDLLDSTEALRQPDGGVYEARGVLEIIHAIFELHNLGQTGADAASESAALSDDAFSSIVPPAKLTSPEDDP